MLCLKPYLIDKLDIKIDNYTVSRISLDRPLRGAMSVAVCVDEIMTDLDLGLFERVVAEIKLNQVHDKIGQVADVDPSLVRELLGSLYREDKHFDFGIEPADLPSFEVTMTINGYASGNVRGVWGVLRTRARVANEIYEHYRNGSGIIDNPAVLAMASPRHANIGLLHGAGTDITLKVASIELTGDQLPIDATDRLLRTLKVRS